MKRKKERTKYVEARPEKAGELAKKLHIKKDEIQFVRKSYISEKGEVNEKERSIVATVSTADRDRDGEVIEPAGIDLRDYQKNPVLMWAHTYKEPPIGRMVWGKVDEEKGMVCKFQFAKTQFADEIYQLYKDGYLKGFSIGFVPLEFDEKEKVHKKIALLEISAVPVPSNQNALVMEAYTKGIIKSARLKKDLEIEVVKDAEIAIVKDKEVEVIKVKNDKKEKERKEETKDEAVAEEEKVVTGTGAKVPAGVTTTEEEAVVEDATEKQKKFNCECIKCGHKLTSEKHCNEIKCPECGGEMRRQERPGPGKDADQEECDHEWGGIICITAYKGEYKKEYKCSKCGATKSISIDEASADGLSATVRITDMDEFKTVIGDLKSEIVELKEGRVLSTKNRTLVKDAIDALVKLKDGLDELYTATEPVVRNEEERTATIEMEKQAVIERDGNAVALDDQVSKKIDEALSGENLITVMKDSVSKAIDVALKKKMGKVE